MDMNNTTQFECQSQPFPYQKLMEINMANTVYFTFVIIVGTFSNLFILLAYHKTQQRSPPEHCSTVLVRTLALIDMLMSLSAFTHFINMRNSAALCTFSAMLHSLPLAFSVGLLIGIALERYFAICRPLAKSPSRNVLIGICLVFAILPTSTYAFMHKVVGKNVCFITNIAVRKVLMTGCAATFYVIPIILLCTLYTMVFRVIYKRHNNKVGQDGRQNDDGKEKSKMKQGTSSLQGSNMSNKKANISKQPESNNVDAAATSKPISFVSVKVRHEETQNLKIEAQEAALSVKYFASHVVNAASRQATDATKTRKPKTLRVQFKTAIMFSLITSIFIISWMPYWVATIDVLFDLNINVSYLVCHVYYLNSLTNPIMYGIFDRRVQVYIVQLKELCCAHLYEWLV